jgi:butyryl-CoA dehydrogenase
MDFELSEEQRLLKRLARDLGDRFKDEVPVWERQDFIPPEDWERMRRALLEHQLLGLSVPEAYGGQGRPFLDLVLVLEEFGRCAPPLNWLMVSSSGGPVQILIALGSDFIKQEYLPRVIRGEMGCAVAMTEPEAGSATTDLATRAVLDGDDYVINGTKVFVGGSGSSELYVVYARLADRPGAAGIGALLVERDAPGLVFGKDSGLVGQRVATRREMIFRDCRVPRRNLVVQPGQFAGLMGAFNTERLQNSAWTLGMAQAAFEAALEYSQRRQQFGRPLCDFQMIQERLADMAVQLEAGRLLIYRAAAAVRDGSAPALASSIAKTFISEAGPRIIDTAIQIHGAYGLTRDLPLERLWRDARGMSIAAGTAQINKVRIVSELTGRRFNQRG